MNLVFLRFKKIKYIKHNNIKRGPQYALVITAGNKELELNKQMEGFDIMVEYLLKKNMLMGK